MKNFLIGFIIVISLIAIGAWTVGRRTDGLARNPADPLARSTVSASGTSGLPILAPSMPEFTGISTWIDSGPITASALKGKVVLVDFWTYSCINCIRTLPYTTSWQEKYKDKGFTIVGVHTPEFAFEKVEANVRQAVDRFKITYPVAMDNAYGTWNAYGNRYWPAEYLFDAQGRLRHVHFGEGEYDKTEQAIQALLKEAGQQADMAVTAMAGNDLGKVASPETYLGYARAEYLGSPEPVARNAPGRYTIAKAPALNRFYFGGEWIDEAERAVSGKDAALVYKYSASQANLVMSGNGDKRRVEISLDGQPVPENFRGADVRIADDGKTYIDVSDERLYVLTDTHGVYGPHTLQLRFLDPSTAAYAFTFG